MRGGCGWPGGSDLCPRQWSPPGTPTSSSAPCRQGRASARPAMAWRTPATPPAGPASRPPGPSVRALPMRWYRSPWPSRASSTPMNCGATRTSRGLNGSTSAWGWRQCCGAFSPHMKPALAAAARFLASTPSPRCPAPANTPSTRWPPWRPAWSAPSAIVTKIYSPRHRMQLPRSYRLTSVVHLSRPVGRQHPAHRRHLDHRQPRPVGIRRAESRRSGQRRHCRPRPPPHPATATPPPTSNRRDYAASPGTSARSGVGHMAESAPPAYGSRRRAVELVLSSGRTVTDVARELGVSIEGLRGWVKQAKADRGEGSAGVLTPAEREELRQLRKRDREQQQTIEILKKGSPSSRRR